MLDTTENSSQPPLRQRKVNEPLVAAAPRELPTLVHRLRWYGQTEHSRRTAFTMVLDQAWNDVQLTIWISVLEPSPRASKHSEALDSGF